MLQKLRERLLTIVMALSTTMMEPESTEVTVSKLAESMIWPREDTSITPKLIREKKRKKTLMKKPSVVMNLMLTKIKLMLRREPNKKQLD